jgi:acetyltransferase EpsM
MGTQEPNGREPGLLFVGGGGHAVVVAEAARGMYESVGLRPVGFLDDRPEAQLARPPGAMAHLGPLSRLPELADEEHSWILAIGDLGVRRRLLDTLPARMPATSAWTVVHRSAIVSRSAVLGRGVFIGPGAIVHSRARIGDHAIINSGAIIEHNCLIGENTHIAPGAVLGGECRTGRDVLVGLGARVIPLRTIGDGCVVGAGAVVLKDLPAGKTAVGVPATVR